MQKSTLYLSLVLAIALSVVTRPASAQDKYYIKLKSTTQGSFQPTQQAARGNGFMECKSIAFSSTAVNSATARSNGMQQHETLKVTIATAVASPQILQDNWTNKEIQEILLEFCKPVKGQEQTYMKITLTKATITAVVVKGDTEEVTFKYMNMQEVETPIK
jgi:type VI secretion system Hcp family effector